MIVKWLDFSDLHFEYTNVDTVNIRDNLLSTISAVSYTHLDVYKRQEQMKHI